MRSLSSLGSLALTTKLNAQSGMHSASYRNTTLIACLSIGLLLTTAGCTSVRIKLGRRIDLTQTPVASIDAKLPKGPGIAPGQKSPLVVTVTEPDGKVLQSEGAGSGKVMWRDLQVKLV